MSALAKALLDELEPGDLAVLAERLAPYLAPAPAPADDGWLTTKDAAAYLGVSVNSLHKADRGAAHPVLAGERGCPLLLPALRSRRLAAALGMHAPCVYYACMTTDPKTWTNVRLPNDLADQLRALAQAHERSLSAELRVAVSAYMGEHDRAPHPRRHDAGSATGGFDSIVERTSRYGNDLYVYAAL